MKEEVLSLIEEASKAIDEFENFMFENSKEQYIGAKSILDKNKENINTMRDSLDNINLEDAKNELENIISTINDAKTSLYDEDNKEDEEEIINNSIPQVDENIFKEETIDNTINTLNNSFENLDDNFIDPFNQKLIEETEESIKNEDMVDITQNEKITDNSDELDIAAIDAFLADNNLDV